MLLTARGWKNERDTTRRYPKVFTCNGAPGSSRRYSHGGLMFFGRAMVWRSVICLGQKRKRLGSLLLVTGCTTGRVSKAGGPYHVTAYRPNNPSAVRVKVSLSKENVYVMEGDRCLMSAAISVGMPNKPTPRGNFTIYSKQEHKRSGSHGVN